MDYKGSKQIMLFVKILYWICLCSLVFISILLIISLFISEQNIDIITGMLNKTIVLGNISLNLKSGFMASGSTKLIIITNLISTIVVLVLSSLLLKTLRNILENTLSGTPFKKDVSKNLKKLSLITLIMILVIPALKAFQAFIELNAYDLDRLFNMNIISNIQLNYNIEVTLLLIPVCLYVFSKVFDYGNELQEFTDDVV